MTWDADSQRVEELLRLREIPLDAIGWQETREYWDERLDEWHRLRRAGVEIASPLTRFERLAALLAGCPGEFTDAFLELAHHHDDVLEVVEPALAALAFQNQIYPTIRAWELCPPSDAERLWHAIERGHVMMTNPSVFVHEGALLVGDDSPTVVFRDVDELLTLAENAWR